MNPMRIAQVMLGKGFGGAERSFVDISRALSERGHAVLAIGDPRGRALAMLETLPGITCRPITCLGSWDRIAAWRIGRRLRDFDAEVVHTHLARAAHLAGGAADRLGIPSIAKTHNLVDARYYRAISHVVPTTQAQADHLCRQGVDPARIEIIPNFSAVEPVDTIRRAAVPPWRVVAVGRLVEKKGFDTLIDASARLRDANVPFRLEIAGDGPERAALTRRVALRNLAGHVQLVGWRDDVPAFLEGAHLFVLPSRDEPFGIVLLEAMARGIPIVATRTQGPLEILSTASAKFVDAEQPAALCAAMQRALGNHRATEMAERAREDFIARYAKDVIVSRYETSYERLIAR